MLSLAFMARIGEIDPDAMTVSAEGGVTLGELCRYLAPRDCALYDFSIETMMGFYRNPDFDRGFGTEKMTIYVLKKQVQCSVLPPPLLGGRGRHRISRQRHP